LTEEIVTSEGEENHGKGEHGKGRHERVLSIVEAVILSLVALAAAWSGYSAAKWDTHSSDLLGKSLELQVQAEAAREDALQIRTFDSVSFDAAFSAYVAHDKPAFELAIKRLRPGYRSAFNAWLAEKPLTNPDAPADPTKMPQYKVPGEAEVQSLTEETHASFEASRVAGNNSDKYVWLTVIFATVLFLIGISSHFPIRSARYGLIGVGCILILYCLVRLLTLPAPPI
jgi:hypothetical protein